MKRVIAGLLILSLAGCGGFARSGWNPKNWFGGYKARAEAAKLAPAGDPALTDPRPMVYAVSGVTVEPASGGLILRVTGVSPGPGYWGPVLLPLAKETAVNGDLVYFFRASPPQGTPLPEPTHLTAAHFVPNSALVGVRRIVISAQTNQKAVRP